MNTDPRPSAKIYQFPRRRPANPAAPSRQTFSAEDRRALSLPHVEYGSGWYHDAAIAAETFRKP